MQKISLPLASAFIIIAAIVGLGAGYALTPEYKSEMFTKSSMELGQADKALDLRYTNAMISHHRAAMLLAEQARASGRDEVKGLAEKILADEPGAIEELYTWKKDWYGDKRAVKDPVVANLGAYDDKLDLRFLNALIAHHEAGLEMTQEVMSKSSRTEVLDNANAVDNFLSTTLVVLKDWRKNWYNI